MTTHEEARVRKTLFWLNDPETFMAVAKYEIFSMLRKAERLEMLPAFRANLLSDDRELQERVAAMFPDLQQYDYTKLRKPWKRVTDKYHLTYSMDLGEDNERHALECFEHGVNVAVVLDVHKKAPMPETYTVQGVTRPMIDGDTHDLRFLDPEGLFVGLRGKSVTGGIQKGRDSGFYREVS